MIEPLPPLKPRTINTRTVHISNEQPSESQSATRSRPWPHASAALLATLSIWIALAATSCSTVPDAETIGSTAPALASEATAAPAPTEAEPDTSVAANADEPDASDATPPLVFPNEDEPGSAPPAPAPTPTPQPPPTPTPEPQDTLTLAEAQAGSAGRNWFAVFDNDYQWQLFDGPDGEPIEVNEFTVEMVRSLMITSGTPDQPWVEVLVPWTVELEQTAWLRTEQATLVASDRVLELNRTTGEQRLWQQGNIIWQAQDVTDDEGRLRHVPLIRLGATTGTVPTDREDFYPAILGVTALLHDIDADFIAPIGIRGFNPEFIPDVSDTGEPKIGWSAWIPTEDLESLLELIGAGVRVQIVA